MRTHRILPLAVLLGISLCGALAVSGPSDRVITDPHSIVSKANPQARPVPVEDLFFTKNVSDAAWSPDGREIALSTNLTGRTNLWKVAASGAWPVQLAVSEDRQVQEAWSPDSRWLVFAQDKGGNELWDLYAVPRDGGEIVNLTHTADVREESPYWSPDGKFVAFNSKLQASSSYDIGILDWNTRQSRKLTHEANGQYLWAIIGWSPDSSRIYATRGNVGNTDASIWSVEVGGGAATELTPHTGKVIYEGRSVAPDGKQVLLGSDMKGGFTNVGLLDVSTRKISWVTDTQWEATPEAFSPDGTHFTYTLNEDGRQDVYLGDRKTLRSRKLSIPPGVNGISGPQHFSPDGRQVLVFHVGSGTPNDYWIYDTSTNSARQLTHTAIASLDPQSLPASQIVHYSSFDGKIISAFLYMPYNLSKDATHPAILYPHGGPTGQTFDSFNRTINALVSRGYIVIAPNPRGSTGYGVDFQKANYQDLGNGDLKDDMEAVKFVLDTGYADPKKVGVTGGSYGGYTTLMAIGKYPQMFAAAVDLFGPLDWYTMMKSSDPILQQYIVSLLGDPEKDRKAYEETSPIKYVGGIKAPLLVLQGDNDPRVPREETDQLIALLKKQGTVVDSKFYPAEGHGFAKRENQVDAIKRTLDWFERYLK